MPSLEEIERLIPDLLREPRETLDHELKGWLDLQTEDSHRALIAKAAIALANHGGGLIIIGFEETGDGSIIEATGRPTDMGVWTQDIVNSAILRYAEPSFHCEVRIARVSGTALQYPVVIVPGGHTIPIRARRDGPGGQTIRQGMYYIRRPGPQSEPPQSGHEWDTLIRRCLANARGDLLDQFRRIMEGGVASVPEQPSETDRLNDWWASSVTRWEEVVAAKAPDHYSRFPFGYYTFAYQLFDPSLDRMSATEVLDALRKGEIRHTSWPPFWVPNRPEIAPYPYDGTVECWLGGEGTFQDAAHADYWRASGDAQFFLTRGYDEDEQDNEALPGTIFGLTIPVIRTGELLLHAFSMAKVLGTPGATVRLIIEYTGLRGRTLSNWRSPRRMLVGKYIARQNAYRTEVSVSAEAIPDALPELVSRITRPLYESFDFFQVPSNLITDELSRMRR